MQSGLETHFKSAKLELNRKVKKEGYIMPMNESPDMEKKRVAVLRMAQVVVAALVLGVVAFMLVAFFVAGGLKPLRTELTISAIAAIVSVVLIVARFVVPTLMTRKECAKIARRTNPASSSDLSGTSVSDGDQEKLLPLFPTRTIVAAAILEGAAFLNLAVFLSEGQVYSLLLAGIMILGIMAGFPTSGRLTSWLTAKTRLVQEIRSLPSRSE